MTRVKNQKPVLRLGACVALLALAISPAVTAGSPATAAGTATASTAARTIAPPRAASTVATSAVAAAPLTEPVSVTLTSIVPAVSVPRAPITISGTVRNTGALPIDAPMARVLIGDRALTSRASVSDWATPAGEAQLAEVVRTPLTPTLAPGAVATFALTVPATAISHRRSFAVLPVSVDVVGSTSVATGSLGSRHTFLPTLSSIREYEPLSVAWLVPLTLDPDPALHGVDSDARTAAWTKAIGTGSRLDRVITGTDAAKVTWAIDPAILGPPPVDTVDGPTADPTSPPNPSTPTTPSAPTAPSTPPTQTPTDPVSEVTTALASRLRAAAPRHTLWALPYADPDLAALLPLPAGAAALQALLRRPAVLDAAVGPTRSGIAWPVDGTLTADREQKLRAASSSSGLAAAVISASTRTARSGFTDDASRKSTGGLPLLAYDQALSRAFAQTSTPATGALSIQLFLADSLALLGERPGTRDRSVLVAAPRRFAGDPTVLAAFFAAVAKARWLTPASTDQLLASAGMAAPEVPAVGTSVTSPPTTPSASPSAPDPISPATSPLSEARLQSISAMTAAIHGVASIRDDTQLFEVRWTDAQEQLLSSRWRGRARGITTIDAATQKAINTVSSGVYVVPSSVNFFADRGVLQITVVNDLAVPVHDVHLTLKPGQPRLRIDQQPGVLRIGGKSRTNVRLNVTAIAAGLVPIRAVLSTANGTPLGQNAQVDVRVQPTSTWIYWVLGGLAGIILVLGIYRSVRIGSTRASRSDAQGIIDD